MVIRSTSPCKNVGCSARYDTTGRPAFTEGMANIRVLTIKDHVATDIHKRAMSLEAKKAASSLMEYAPIVRAKAQANLSEAARLKVKRKMDIAYTIAKENLHY